MTCLYTYNIEIIVKITKTCSEPLFVWNTLNRDVRLYVVNLLVTFATVPLCVFYMYNISHFKNYTLIMHGIEIY